MPLKRHRNITSSASRLEYSKFDIISNFGIRISIFRQSHRLLSVPGHRTTHASPKARGSPHVNNLVFLIFHPLLIKQIDSIISLSPLVGESRREGVKK